MIRPLTLAAVTLVTATLLFACSLVKKELSPPPVPEQKLPAAPTPTPRPEPTPTPHKRHRRRHRHILRPSPSQPTEEPVEPPTPLESPEATTGSTPTPAPSPSATPAPAGPTLSIGSDTANEARVNGLLDQANGNLAKANPATLAGDDRTAYDQAKSLVGAAKKARDKNDYLAASGLAQKAVVLSSRFAGGGTP